jgi:hypothetical protein
MKNLFLYFVCAVRFPLFLLWFCRIWIVAKSSPEILPFRFRSSPVTLVLVLPLAFHFSFPSLVFGVVCSRVKTRCRSTKIRFCWVDSRSGAQKEFPSRTVWRHRFPLPPDFAVRCLLRVLLPSPLCRLGRSSWTAPVFCRRRCAGWVGPREQLRSTSVPSSQSQPALTTSSRSFGFARDSSSAHGQVFAPGAEFLAAVVFASAVLPPPVWFRSTARAPVRISVPAPSSPVFAPCFGLTQIFAALLCFVGKSARVRLSVLCPDPFCRRSEIRLPLGCGSSLVRLGSHQLDPALVLHCSVFRISAREQVRQVAGSPTPSVSSPLPVLPSVGWCPSAGESSLRQLLLPSSVLYEPSLSLIE